MANHFVVTWRDPQSAEFLQLKVKSIQDSQLGLTFVALSDFVLEAGTAIVNPTQEALHRRFEHTKMLHLSIHSIASIEEVGPDHQGLTLQGNRTNLLLFPPEKR